VSNAIASKPKFFIAIPPAARRSTLVGILRTDTAIIIAAGRQGQMACALETTVTPARKLNRIIRPNAGFALLEARPEAMRLACWRSADRD
jgi:hypothetical protein